MWDDVVSARRRLKPRGKLKLKKKVDDGADGVPPTSTREERVQAQDLQEPEAGMLQLKAQCSKCKCVLLGREITMDSFVQLRTQAADTQRIDLTSDNYAQVSPKGLSELGDLFPQLVAVFTSPSRISVEAVEAVRPLLPVVRCLQLGREVSAAVYAGMERQLEDTRMLDLTSGLFCNVTDAGIAELVNIPGLCGNLEALFTSKLIMPAALDTLKPQCSWAQCVLLGQEIDLATFQALRASFRERQVVDLSGSQFDRLTVTGLGEIVAMCPDVAALADAAKQVQARPELSAFLMSEISRLASSGLAVQAAPALVLPHRGHAMDEETLAAAHQQAGGLKAALDAQFPMRFSLQEILGAGGSGLIVKARDKRLGVVAIKIVTPQVNGVTFTEKERVRLEREVATMRRATHANVCTCHESFFTEDDKLCVMVLEHLNGESLEEMVASRGGPLEEVEVLRIVTDCLEALKVIHGEHLIHRDLKPSNVMAHQRGDGTVVWKIIDFGIAMASDDDEGATVSTAMKTGGVRGIGTAHYMSREQYSGDELTKLTDIYSLGVTMFFALTGKVPFAAGETKATKVMFAVCGPTEAPSVQAVTQAPATISDKVAEIVAQAVRKEAEERFQSAEEMLGSVTDAMTRRGYAKYDAMISYRSESEAAFASSLYAQMSRKQIDLANGRTRRMRVFLDRERLEAGERWDQGFIQNGVAASTLVLPLISAGALTRMSTLASPTEDTIDWLLLEWEVTLALEAAGRVGKVYPILIGKQDDTGVRTDFFEDGSATEVALPDSPSPLTAAETAKFLQDIDSSITPEVRSVRGTLDALLRFQAFNLRTQSGVHGSDATETMKLHDEEATAATVAAVMPVVSAAVNEAAAKAALSLAAMEPEPEPEPESEQGGGTPRTPAGGMKMKDVVDAIKNEIGLEGSMTPKQVIAAASDQYGVEVGGGPLKEQVKAIAMELGIATGW
jgi:serine/threonine protein kinase